MGIDWGSVAAVAGVGALSGLAAHKVDVKEKEQRDKEKEQLDYDRGRQAVADQQSAELHNQTVQKNDNILQADAREQAEAARRKSLNDQIGKYMVWESNGDIESAAKSFVDYGNTDNVGNPNFNPNHMLGYTKNTDGTVNINVIDRASGKIIKVARENVGTKDFIKATYQQIDPTKIYEGQVAAAAKTAEDAAKNAFELQKLGIQGANSLAVAKANQEGANWRTEVTQEGLNYRHNFGNGSGGGTGGGSGGGKGGKQSNAVASGVGAAVQFAENNRPMMNFLTSNPRLANLTIAMMGIESGANPSAVSYDGSSHGLMQINSKYAAGFAKQFNIKGNPITDPQANLQTGAAYINHLDKKYHGNIDLIAAAYNAGEPAIDLAVKKGGAQWYNHLDLSMEAKQQVLGHVAKFNQAIGLVDGKYRYTGLDPNQQAESTAQQTKHNYVRQATAASMVGINTAVTSLSSDLGVKNKAALMGDLSPAQNHITAFANKPDLKSRNTALMAIVSTVEKAVKNTEAGRGMTPSQINLYAKQKAAEMVGVSSYPEAALWVAQGSKPQPAKQPSGNLSGKEVDNVFMDIQVTDTPSPTKSTPKQANPMQRDSINQTLANANKKPTFIPYKAAPSKPQQQQRQVPRQAPTMARNMGVATMPKNVNTADWERAKKYYLNNQ